MFLVLTACIEVKFRESQPPGVESLAEIPESFHGMYFNEDGDTLILTSSTFSLVNRKSKCNTLTEFDSLNENIQLKILDDYMFFNMNEDSLWTVALVTPLEDNSFRFSLIDAEDEEILQAVSSITDLGTHLSEEGEPLVYVANPSPDELNRMIQEDIFSVHYTFTRIPHPD
jgi:hypothetical protein